MCLKPPPPLNHRSRRHGIFSLGAHSCVLDSKQPAYIDLSDAIASSNYCELTHTLRECLLDCIARALGMVLGSVLDGPV